MTKKQKIAYYIMLVITTALFLFTGYDKLRGDPTAVAGFAALGLPVWFMYVIGAGEVLGAIGLWINKTFRYAYEGLFLVLIGAVVTTAISMSAVFVLLPIAVAVILGVIIWLHNRGSQGPSIQ